ncbi:MAG: hypothetical protein WBA16_02555 [Nonlabens sp.]
MDKIYDSTSSSKNLKQRTPREETIQTILSFSKSLEIVNCRNMQFESNKN